MQLGTLTKLYSSRDWYAFLPVVRKHLLILACKQSKKTTEEDLRREFEMYGKIERIRIVKDKKGKSKSYAFIVYERERDMKGTSARMKSLNLANIILHSRLQGRRRNSDTSQEDLGRRGARKNSERMAAQKAWGWTRRPSQASRPNSSTSCAAFRWQLPWRNGRWFPWRV